MRESIFNLLQSRIDMVDANVVDLFAGSGALGLEALSRGARHVTFVDNDFGAIRTIQANARHLGVSASCTIRHVDALTFLAREKAGSDLILADPPYGFEVAENLVPLALNRLNTSGLFVLEHEGEPGFEEGQTRVDCSRRYGRTVVTIFC